MIGNGIAANIASSAPPTSTRYSELWTSAIGKAERRRRTEPSEAREYLYHLKDLLEGGGESTRARRRRDDDDDDDDDEGATAAASAWNHPPTFAPPPPLWEDGSSSPSPPPRATPRLSLPPEPHYDDGGAGYEYAASLEEIASSMPRQLAVSGAAVPRGGNARAAGNRNQYSVLDEGDDEDSENDVSDEGGFVRDRPSSTQRTNRNGGIDYSCYRGSETTPPVAMSVRRILLRVHCSLAEIHSSLAVECSRTRPVARWIEGADEFQAAYATLLSGQEIIDEEHALLMQAMEVISAMDRRRRGNGDGELERLRGEIRERQEVIGEDSRVASVPLAYFSESRDRYVRAAEARVAHLEGRLYENNSARREVMQKMGDRWRNNPAPRMDYAERRRLMERELDDALEGMNRTRGMNVGEFGAISPY